MPAGRSSRVVRGSAAAWFSTFVALLLHTAAGGEMPGMVGIAVPLAFSSLICIALVGRRLSLTRLSLAVAVSQVLFHGLFVLGSGQGRSAASGADTALGAGAHGSHGGAIVLDATTTTHFQHTDGAMWVAHLVAGVVTVAALHRAETILSTLGAATRFVLSRLRPVGAIPLVLPARPLWPLLRDRVALPHPIGVYPETTALRGPPAILAL